MMLFECKFEVTVITDKKRVITKLLNREFDLPFYREDMHPDGLGYYQYFAYDGAEEEAINNFIEYAEIKDIEDDFCELLEEDEIITEILG